MFQITDSQQVGLSLQGADKKGNPTGPLPAGTTATWSVDNPNVLAVTPSTDTLSCNVVAVGPLSPGATVSVSVKNPDGSDGGTGSLQIAVVTGSPTSIAIVPGTPTEQP